MNVVSINKVIFVSILILLGGVLVSCSRSGEGEVIGGYAPTPEESTPYPLCDSCTAVEDFDFSAHMRIDDLFVKAMERDLSYVDVFDGVDSGIRLRGFENGKEITVREGRLRVDGSALWHPIYMPAFGAKLNGEIIPYGNPILYEYLKYGYMIDNGLGVTSFFVEMDLTEGENVVEFVMAHLNLSPNFRNDNSDFQVMEISNRRIYVYYRP